MAERYRLSRIPKRDQTAGAEVWEEADGSIVQYVNGDPVVTAKINGVIGGITKISKLTQAQYDAIVTKDDSTLYVIVA